MNFLKIYDALIDKYKNLNLQKNQGTYLETHHILPKSMGGTNDKENLVNLTAKAHYIAHHLLWKIYRNKEMAYAFWMFGNHTATTYETIKKEIAHQNKLNFSGENNPMYGVSMLERLGFDEEKYKLWKQKIGESGRKYIDSLTPEERQKIYGRVGEDNSFYGKHHTDKQRAKWSKIRKGKNTGEDNSFYGKHHTEESKQKIREKLIGRTRVFSDEHKNNLSISIRGEKNGMYGKHHTEESKQKMIESQKKSYKKRCQFEYIINEESYYSIKGIHEKFKLSYKKLSRLLKNCEVGDSIILDGVEVKKILNKEYNILNK